MRDQYPDLDLLTGRKGKGSTGEGGVREAPNTLRSTSKAKIIDLVSEGEIGGLVDGAKSIYLNEVPLQNSDDSYNFQGFRWVTREGLPDQTSIPGFSEAEATIAVGAEVKAAIPVTRSIDGSTMDALRLAIKVTGLQHVKQEEQVITGTTVSLKFIWKTNPGGSVITEQTVTISGKTTSPYERSYYLELPGTDTYTLEVQRITPDSETIDIQNGTIWSSYTAINESKFSYPDSALIGIEIDAQQFGSQPPKRAYRLKGRKVKVPSNYDAATRVYTGIWDGTFIEAITSNPAWIWFDLATHDRYGLGEELGISNVDKWAVYNIGVYCDGNVDDGQGGTEPRFTFKGVIQEQREAWEVLNVLASTFRGMMYWGSGSVTLIQDSPKSPEIEVNQTRVIGGMFRYQKSAKKARHTAVFVTWTDPNNFGRPAVEVVEDRVGIATLGYRRKDVVLHGCTSRAMAHRAARWIIYSELNETETVSYVCHADHLNVRPGSVIRLSDPERLGVRNAGRIAGVSGSTLTLDKAYDFDAGETYQISVLDASGAPELVNLTNPGTTSTDTVVMLGSPSRTPLVGEAFAILGTDVTLPQYRVLSIREVEVNEVKCYEVTALEYNNDKFASVEEGIDFPVESYTKLPAMNKMDPPSTISLSRQIEVISPQAVDDYIDIGWSQSDDRYIDRYFITYSRTGDPEWKELGTTVSNSARIDFPYADTYTVRVYARNVFGVLSSTPVEGTITVESTSPIPAPSVSGLELFEQGNNTEFEGKDAVFTWRRASGMAQSPGAERFGGDSSSTDPLFQHYQVDVRDGNGNLLRREFVTDNFYTYTYENNFDDNNGAPLRSFEVEVSYVNRYNEVGRTESLTVTNTKPALPDVTITASYREIYFDYLEPNDPDFRGMIVWADTSPSVSTTDGNVVFKGPGKPSFSASADTTYYYKYAVYDEFGTDGLVASDEGSITTLEPIDDIPDGSITLTKLAGTVQDEINRVMEIGKSVIPPGISGGVNGDAYFHKNELTTGADDGEIRVSNGVDDGGDGWFNHPTLGRIDETGTNGQIFHTPFNILTPWEGSTVPRGERFYIMYSNSDWSSRFGGGLTDPATGNAYVGVVTYDDVNDQWYAHDNTNTAGVAFTPANTDVLLAVGTKESVSGGIDSMRSLVGVNAPLEQRVSNTEILVGDAGDTADAGGSVYARIAQEILGRQNGDTALAYRLDTVEAGAVLPNLTDVHPDLVWQWNDGTGSGDATSKASVTTALANNGIEITATADTGQIYAGWALSADQQAAVDWERVRYAVVVMEFVSGQADIPVTPEFNWRSGTNNGGAWLHAVNKNENAYYETGKMYTFVFDLEGSTDAGAVAWGTADPTVWWIAPADSSDQTTNDKWRIHKSAFVAYGDLSYSETKARADIFQEALFDGGTSTATIMLQTQAGTGNANTVARAWLTSRAGGDGALMSEIGFQADDFSIWNSNAAANLPVFQVTGTKIRMDATNVEIDGNLLVAGTVSAAAMNVGFSRNLVQNSDFSADFSSIKIGTNANVTKTFESAAEGTAFGSEQALVLTSTAADQTDNAGPGDASGANRHDYDVTAGEKYEASVYAQATNAGNAQLVVQFYSAYAGGYLSGEDFTYSNTTASTDGTLANMDRLGGVFTVPATAVRMRILLNGLSLENTEVAKFRRLMVSKATANQTVLSDWTPAGGTRIDGQGIVADSITGTHIFAESEIKIGSDANSFVGLSGNSSYDWRIWAGSFLGAGAPFSVDKNGHVTMRSFTLMDDVGNIILRSGEIPEYLRSQIFSKQNYSTKQITGKLNNNLDFYTITLDDDIDDVRVAARHAVYDVLIQSNTPPATITIEIWHTTSDPDGQNDAWWTANATKIANRDYTKVATAGATANQFDVNTFPGASLFGEPATDYYQIKNVSKSDHNDTSVPDSDTFSQYVYDQTDTEATYTAGTHYFRVKVYDAEGDIEAADSDKLGREIVLLATGSGSFILEDSGDTTGSAGEENTFTHLTDTPLNYSGSRRNVPMVEDVSSPGRMFFKSVSEISRVYSLWDFDIRPENSATVNQGNYEDMLARIRDVADELYTSSGAKAVIFAPPGTYRFDDVVFLPESIMLYGSGQNSTTFLFEGSVADAAFCLEPYNVNGYNAGAAFKDFSITTSGVWDEAIKVAWPDLQTGISVTNETGNFSADDVIFTSTDGTWANRTWTAQITSYDGATSRFFVTNEDYDPRSVGVYSPVAGDEIYNNDDTGEAIWFDRNIAFVNESRVYAEHINIYGTGVGNYFKKGIMLKNVAYYDLKSIRYIGSNADATHGSPVYYDGTAIDITTQIDADDNSHGQSLEGHIDHLTASDCNIGVNIFGFPEGQYISHSNIVRARIGITATAKTGTTQPSLVVHHNHINAASMAMQIDGYSQFHVDSNSFSYWNDATVEASFNGQAFIGLNVINDGDPAYTEEGIIIGNTFVTESIPSGKTGNVTHLYVDADHTIVDHNQFIGDANGDNTVNNAILIAGGSGSYVGHGNRFTNNIDTNVADTSGNANDIAYWRHTISGKNTSVGGEVEFKPKTDGSYSAFIGQLGNDGMLSMRDHEGNIRFNMFRQGQLEFKDTSGNNRLIINDAGTLIMYDESGHEAFNIGDTDIVLTSGHGLNMGGGTVHNAGGFILAGGGSETVPIMRLATGTTQTGPFWNGNDDYRISVEGTALFAAYGTEVYTKNGLFALDDTDTGIDFHSAGRMDFQADGQDKLRVQVANVAVVNVPLYVGKSGIQGGDIQFQAPSDNDHIMYLRHSNNGQFAVQSYDAGDVDFEFDYHIIANRSSSVNLYYNNVDVAATHSGGLEALTSFVVRGTSSQLYEDNLQLGPGIFAVRDSDTQGRLIADGGTALTWTDAGGTLTGAWNVTSSLTVGGTAVSVAGHTHTIANVTGLQTALDGKVALAGDTMTGTLVAPTVNLTSTSSLQYSGANRIKFGASLTQFVNSSIYAARISGAGAQIQLQGPSGAYVGYLNHAANGQIAIQSYDGSAIETMANFYQGGGVDLFYDTAIKLSTTSAGGTLTGTWNATTALTVGGTAVSLAGHAHAISDVTGLQTALDGKAASSHTHTIANVTGLQTALDGKSDTGHTHSYLPLAGGIMSGVLDMDGQRIDLDADNDTYIYSSADDTINFYAGTVENMIINANVVRARYAGVDRLITAIDGTTVNSIGTYGARIILENQSGTRTWGLVSPIGADQFVLQDIITAKNYLAANKNGSTAIYYDGGIRAETTSAGGTLTGTWNATTNLQIGGASVATQTWVSSQGYTTGGPFLPLTGGTLTGRLVVDGGTSNGLSGDGGGVYIQVNDQDFCVWDSTDGVTNIIWRDHSAGLLYLGTADAIVTLRSDFDLNGNRIVGMGTSTWHTDDDTDGRLQFVLNGDNLYAGAASGAGHEFYAHDGTADHIRLDPANFRIYPSGADSNTYWERHVADAQRWIAGGNVNLSIDANRVYLQYQGNVIAQTYSDRLQLMETASVGGKIRFEGHGTNTDWTIVAQPDPANQLAFTNLLGSGASYLMFDDDIQTTYLYGGNSVRIAANSAGVVGYGAWTFDSNVTCNGQINVANHLNSRMLGMIWADMSSDAGGYGVFGGNLYANWDGAAVSYRTSLTHASVGYGALRFGYGNAQVATFSGATTAGATVTPTWNTLWHSGNFTPGNYLPLTGGTMTGVLTASAGAKIVVQNGTDGGSTRGLFMWTSADTNWGIYMAQSGSGKALNGGYAPTSLDGQTYHHIRFRVANNNSQGFIWENGGDTTLMSLSGSSGVLRAKSEIYANATNLVWHAGNFTPGNYLPLAGGTLTGALNATSGISLFYTTTGQTIEAATGQIATQLQIYQPTSGTDALMCFHVAGNYAAYFGLDGSRNDFVVGGWSMGTTSYKIFHEGNFTPGNYLPLAGGTMTGALINTNSNSRFAGLSIGADTDIYLYEGSPNDFVVRTGASGSNKYFTFTGGGDFLFEGHIRMSNADPYIKRTVNDGYLVLSGGSGWTETSSTVVLRGISTGTNPGGIEFNGGNGGAGEAIFNTFARVKINGSTSIDHTIWHTDTNGADRTYYISGGQTYFKAPNGLFYYRRGDDTDGIVLDAANAAIYPNWSSDSNTYLRWGGADIIDLVTGGYINFTVDANRAYLKYQSTTVAQTVADALKLMRTGSLGGKLSIQGFTSQDDWTLAAQGSGSNLLSLVNATTTKIAWQALTAGPVQIFSGDNAVANITSASNGAVIGGANRSMQVGEYGASYTGLMTTGGVYRLVFDSTLADTTTYLTGQNGVRILANNGDHTDRFDVAPDIQVHRVDDVEIGMWQPSALTVRRDYAGTTQVLVQNAATGGAGQAIIYGGSIYIQHIAYQSGSAYMQSNASSALYMGGTGAATIYLRQNGATRLTINSTTSTFSTDLTVDGGARIGTTVGQYGALLTARGASAGDAFEWGHGNTAGYGSVLGYESGTGRPFIGFSAGHGTSTASSYRTFGLKGSVLRGNLAGGFEFCSVDTTTADNQTATVRATINTSGLIIPTGKYVISDYLWAAVNNATGFNLATAHQITATCNSTDVMLLSTSGITALPVGSTGGSIILEGESGQSDWLWAQNNSQCTIGNETDLCILMRENSGNSDVLLYFNNLKKFQTTTSGITVTGTVNETSDRRVKGNIEDITNGMDFIRSLNPRKYFNFLTQSYEEGFVAQEIEKVGPWLVQNPTEPDDYMTMNYKGLIAPMVKAIQEKDDEIQDLKSEVDQLKAQIAMIKKAVGLD